MPWHTRYNVCRRITQCASGRVDFKVTIKPQDTKAELRPAGALLGSALLSFQWECCRSLQGSWCKKKLDSILRFVTKLCTIITIPCCTDCVCVCVYGGVTLMAGGVFTNRGSGGNTDFWHAAIISLTHLALHSIVLDVQRSVFLKESVSLLWC